MNNPVLDKMDRILIIGEAEDETRRSADALASAYNISAAPNVSVAAERMEKLTEEQERLKFESVRLRSTERIERIAKYELGMQFPGPSQIRNLELLPGGGGTSARSKAAGK